MSKSPSEYSIKDNEGRLVLTLKLIDEKTRIFIGEKEIMTCMTVALEFSEDDFPALKNIESIDDILYQYEERDLEDLIAPNEAFWVHCSNLETWVMHDYDTRLLDSHLSFVLLKELANQGIPCVKMKFKEELLERLKGRNEDVRTWLIGQFHEYFSLEEIFSNVSETQRDAVVIIRKLVPANLYLPTHDIGINQEGLVEKLRLIIDNPLDAKQIETLQAAISKLTSLEILGIHDQTNNQIVARLSPLPQLKIFSATHIDLSQLFDRPNQFPSLEQLFLLQLPKEWMPTTFKYLKRLKYLTVLDCSEITLPDSLGELLGLYNLEIDRSGIITLPESVGMLVNLKKVIIDQCSLEFLPASFGNLKNLEWLELRDCKLKHLPKSLKGLESLINVNISGNELVEFPVELTCIRPLKELDLSKNRIKFLPAKIEEFKALDLLNVDRNCIEKIDPNFKGIASLERLNLSYNNLDSLPSDLSGFNKLAIFDLHDNHFTEIPLGIRTLPMLKSLWLWRNPLEKIPEWIFTEMNLKFLDINECNVPLKQVENLKKKYSKVKISS